MVWAWLFIFNGGVEESHFELCRVPSLGFIVVEIVIQSSLVLDESLSHCYSTSMETYSPMYVEHTGESCEIKTRVTECSILL